MKFSRSKTASGLLWDDLISIELAALALREMHMNQISAAEKLVELENFSQSVAKRATLGVMFPPPQQVDPNLPETAPNDAIGDLTMYTRLQKLWYLIRYLH